MKIEFITIIALVICIVILCLEFLWLFILADKQEENIKSREENLKKIKAILDAIINAPTQNAQSEEARELSEMCENNDYFAKQACECLLPLEGKSSDKSESYQQAIKMIHAAVNPLRVYAGALEDKDIYIKCQACRMLSEFSEREKMDEILALASIKNRELRYNVAMAAARFGCKEEVKQFILLSQSDYKYSYRIILELLATYKGDLYELSKELLDTSEEYMQSVIIKGVAPYKIPEILPWCRERLKSSSAQIRIACVKAISFYDDERLMHDLIISASDSNWVVRSAAIRGLEKYTAEKAIETVKTALRDSEWWVRQTAAKVLVNMDIGIEHMEEILEGYDKYASDAVKYSLYRSIDMREEK